MQFTYVTRIINFSIVDGIGNRTAVFLQGCNARCLYCHNPETQEIIKDNSHFEKLKRENKELSKLEYLSSEEVCKKIVKNMPFIRGVTISGGECTLHRDFLSELCLMLKRYGLSIYLDSNGTYDFEKDKTLLDVIDGVMLDIKAYDEEEHKKLTKVTNKIVLKNLKFLLEMNKLIELRTVCIEGAFNYKQTISEISKICSGNKNVLYRIIKYRENGVLDEYKKILKAPKDEELEELKKMVINNGMTAIIT